MKPTKVDGHKKKARRGGRPVLSTVQVGDLLYRVVLVSPRSKGPEGWESNLEGLTELEAGRIYLDSRLRGARRTRVLVHEIVHAVLDASGAGRLLYILADHEKREHDEVEEDFVRMITPMLVGALRSAGLLRGS